MRDSDDAVELLRGLLERSHEPKPEPFRPLRWRRRRVDSRHRTLMRYEHSRERCLS
jgi:hypothetical protein